MDPDPDPRKEIEVVPDPDLERIEVDPDPAKCSGSGSETLHLGHLKPLETHKNYLNIVHAQGNPQRERRARSKKQG